MKRSRHTAHGPDADLDAGMKVMRVRLDQSRRQHPFVTRGLLGQGSFGEVWKVEPRRGPPGSPRAAKILAFGWGADAKRENTLRELRIAQLLSVGPCMAPVERMFVDTREQKVHLVMPCLSGGSLFEQLGPQLPDVNDVRRWVRQVLTALAYAHARGIMHRDVKLDNVMLDGARHNAFLIDWSLGRINHGACRLTPRVVSSGFRAWELLLPPRPDAPSGERQYGFPVDVWAAGCILAYLLGLRVPACVVETPDDEPARSWHGSEMDELNFWCQVLGTPPGHDELPQHAPPVTLHEHVPRAGPRACDLLAQMWAVDPDQRPTAAAALKHPWFSAMDPLE
jgi:casein kinase II subunit alpha